MKKPGTTDFLMFGHVSRDVMIYPGSREEFLGGGVVYASAAAAASGRTVKVVTKAADPDRHLLDVMRREGVELEILPSAGTTSIQNVYRTEDRERREVTLLSGADPFTPGDIPGGDCRIVHFAGLFAGELSDDLIPLCADRAPLAVDAQGILRHSGAGTMRFLDWKRKHELLPYITYLKVDAAEAEVLTGTTDREEAALLLAGWGAKEVMVTHSSEVIVAAEGRIVRAPFTARNLSGRTGRGDTCFASYLSMRLESDVKTALDYSAALTSIKMETPGPFLGSRAEVMERMKTDG